MIHTAILVDGGFYRKRAAYLWGRKSPEDRANELNTYCIAHIKDTYDLKDERYLYRIFYYDCPPLESTVFHPLLKKNIYFAKSITYSWTYEFFTKLKEKRKFALRLGTLSDDHAGFSFKQEQLKKICSKTLLIDDL